MTGRDERRTDGGNGKENGNRRRGEAGSATERPADTARATPGMAGENGTPDGRDERERDTRAREDLNARLAAVERAVTGADTRPTDLSDEAVREERLDDIDDRLDDLETRVAELEGGLQAVRGYVGDVRAVNRDVERRADAALAAASGERSDDGGRERPVAGGDTGGQRGRRSERDEQGRNEHTDGESPATDPPARDRYERCERCGRPESPRRRTPEHDRGHDDHDGGGAAAGSGDGPEGGRLGGATTQGRTTEDNGTTDRRSERELEPAPGMGADLDVRADGYRPPAVASAGDDEESAGGPLSRLRDAL